ncbi:hypothetical protein LOZ54_003194 [Ophidiomyces ophidiicola]|nr:hypothetical protein LOZ54_003194 [Ophidiomyces ophidiicola]
MAENHSTHRLSRLQVLQMEDLGLARRDYISTREAGRKPIVSLDHLEACRASNKEGTQSHRLAIENKDKLKAWKEAWKTLGDATEGEDLAPILEGQSHRYNLIESIKANGGQKYDEEIDTSVHPRGRRALGAPGSRARGGGVIGTRGRQSASTTDRGKIAPSASRRPLDPAKNINNPQSPPRRGSKRGAQIHRSPRPVTMRPRVPIVSPLSMRKQNIILADSTSFMAAVSNLQTVRTALKPLITPEKHADTPVNTRLEEIIDNNNANHSVCPIEVAANELEAEFVDAVEIPTTPGKTAIPPPQNTTPESQTLVPLEVFGSPSAEVESQTNSRQRKVDNGFSSSLPQPNLYLRRNFRPASAKQAEQCSESTVTSSPLSLESKNTKVVSVNTLRASSLSPDSRALSESETFTSPETFADVAEVNVAGEMSKMQQELEELKDMLSGTVALAPSIVRVLESRKKDLEETIFLKSTRPCAPADTPQSKKNVEHASSGFDKSISILAPKDDPAQMGLAIKSHPEDITSAIQSKIPYQHDDLNGNEPEPSLSGEFRKPPVPNDGGNIIGNHLLPGRTRLFEPMSPPLISERPNKGKAVVKDEKAKVNNSSKLASSNPPGSTAVAARTTEPAPPPQYGSQLQMRETPFIPQTAAAMQYGGQSSQTSPSRSSRQHVPARVPEPAPPRIRGRGAHREQCTDSSNEGRLTPPYHPTRVPTPMPSSHSRLSQSEINIKKPEPVQAQLPPGPRSNISAPSCTDNGSRPQTERKKKQPEGLGASRWASEDDKQEPKKAASSGLAASRWAH